MIQLDVSTVRSITGIQFVVLPTLLLAILWQQRNRALLHWVAGGWLFGVGSLLLVAWFPYAFPGSDLIVRTIFFSALVARLGTISEELKHPISSKKIVMMLVMYVLAHELTRYLWATELSRQIFTSSITSLFSLYVGGLAFKLFRNERINGAIWIGSVFTAYGVLFAVRVTSLSVGAITTNQFSPALISETIALALVIFPVIDNMGYLALCLERVKRSEVTARKIISDQQASELLDRQITHLDRQRALAYMASSIAHELNQPLTVISSSIQLAKKITNSPETKAAELEELLKLLETNSQHATNLVGRIRSYIKPSLTPHDVVNMNQIIFDSITLMQPQLRSRGIKLTFTKDVKSLQTFGSAIELTQVLVNLLQNSSDALKDQPKREIKIHLIDETDCISLCIEDSGNGFPDKVIANFDTEFFTTKQNGMGLGLSISQFIANQHNGSLEFHNKISGGALAKLTLPKHV